MHKLGKQVWIRELRSSGFLCRELW